MEAALKEIDIMVRARYSILYLVTHEEGRLEAALSTLGQNQGKKLFTWTGTSGFTEVSTLASPPTRSNQFNDPGEALNHIHESKDAAIFLLKDFHPFLDDPQIVRRLRDLDSELKGTYKTIMICAPRLNLPVDLEKAVTVIDIPLPDERELFKLLETMALELSKTDKNLVKINRGQAVKIAQAAQGLTLSEAENVFSRAVVTDRMLTEKDIDLVLAEKRQIIRKTGVLEFFTSEGSFADVGGLSNLKSWLNVRAKSFEPAAEKFGLPHPKGVLLLGAPGCGKSLTAKVIGNVWKMPLLRLDFGSIFSGLVGSSEENMRRALKVAEGLAPVILWIDEIEKGLAGGAGGGGDSGTSARVFGTFLTWMQEKKSKVFVLATANKIELLPPELLRKGRFDEIFFMDLPSADEREEIFRVHLKKRNRESLALDLTNVVSRTEGFSGAEIEHCVVEGLYNAYHESRELTADDLLRAAAETVPLSVTYAESLRALREWAKDRARAAHMSPSLGKSNRASRIEFGK